MDTVLVRRARYSPKRTPAILKPIRNTDFLKSNTNNVDALPHKRRVSFPSAIQSQSLKAVIPMRMPEKLGMEALSQKSDTDGVEPKGLGESLSEKGRSRKSFVKFCLQTSILTQT